jgi:hypothetical protein
MSGSLYRRTWRRAGFNKCDVILTEGKLLIFRGAVRSLSGAQLPHTHNQRQGVLDLRDCYVYSGIITAADLLHQHRSVESPVPGRHSAPRIYLDDGWTSTDEDTATCFVIWYTARKSLFRGEEVQQQRRVRSRWRQVSALGVLGRSIVFKARSRVERDMWVLAIETEIDRQQQQEDMRIVSSS